MSELETSRWIELSIEGKELRFSCRPAEAEYQIAHRYGTPENPGYVVLLTDGEITFYERPINPRSTARIQSGMAAVADWREYGSSTGSEITVRDEMGSVLHRIELDASSPFIALSAGGSYLAISAYDGKTRIIDLGAEELVTLHNNLLDDRQKPLFVGSGPELRFGRNKGKEPIYGISLDNTVVWRSNEFQEHSFIESLSLEAGINWNETCMRLREAYTDGDSAIQQRVVDKLTEASLAGIKSAETLRKIREELLQLHEVMRSDSHKKAAAILLADANYRLARAQHRNQLTDHCLGALEEALMYANEGLPWYDAKILVAKCHRFQARLYRQRGDFERATDKIERLFKLNREYDVQLVTEGDLRLREELSN